MIKYKTLEEVTNAVDKGIKVYWESSIYEVIGGRNGYGVNCTINGSMIGYQVDLIGNLAPKGMNIGT